MTEPERGFEPADLPFTKRLLFLLSYSGINNTITKREIAVNNHLMPADALCYTINGGYKSETSYAGKSSIGEIYMDDSLQPSISDLEQLSPSSQEMIKSLILKKAFHLQFQ